MISKDMDVKYEMGAFLDSSIVAETWTCFAFFLFCGTTMTAEGATSSKDSGRRLRRVGESRRDLSLAKSGFARE